MPDPFTYRAHIGRTFFADREPVVDGDTIWFRIDKGFHDYFITPVRLLDVDTREISFMSHDSIEYERGLLHKEFTRRWLQDAMAQSESDWPFRLETELGDQTGTYGRVLATVHAVNKDMDLASALLEEFDDVEVYE